MSYSPDEAAILEGIAFTRQLSQRDLSLQIPVNYVPVPAVALTAACFEGKRYEDASTVKCFSNLLAVGFRRFEVDIYWDTTRNIWSLCPVELGGAISNGDVAIREALDMPGLALRNPLLVMPEVEDVDDFNMLTRRAASPTDSLTVPHTATSLSTQKVISASTTVTLASGSLTGAGGTISPPQPTGAQSAGTLIQVGSYSCTPSVNLGLLLRVLSSHLQSTQTNVNATLKYVVLNLHGATSPNGVLTNLSDNALPHGLDLLGSIVTAPATNLSNYIYTPDNLADQRADLNASFSWYGVNPSREPDSAYFDVNESGGNKVTPNGWPAESFVEMTQAKRLIVAFGDVGPELGGYNLTADTPAIFSPGYIQRSPAVTVAQSGGLGSGCFFDVAATAVSQVNNSFAAVAINSSSFSGLNAVLKDASSFTSCGITPLLNSTLGGTTADDNFQPYQQFVDNTIWSWGVGQPQDKVDPNADDQAKSHRCAVLNSASGFWRTENCGATHFSACRTPGQPYTWSISRSGTTYMEAGLTCGEGTIFDTPRTALENDYLLHKWRDTIKADSRDVDGDTLVWVNFNDLDAKACWVIGQNATCPYLQQRNHERDVLVPTVAAVIVFVLAVATVFVKCASNRQRTKSRRRRRGDDGWDYEGVPS